MERLNRILATAGIASRRAADVLIEEGRVTVNDKIVTALGTKADPVRDKICVNGQPIPAAPEHSTYLMLHKPKGYVTTLSDPEGRKTIGDLLPKGVRLFPVGRLDYHTEGLLLLTNDGMLSRDLTHPSKHVEKTYQAKLRGRPTVEALDRLRNGFPLDGRRTKPAIVRVKRPGHHTWVEIVLTEGRRQQIRRMCLAIGHPVIKLKRSHFGPLALADLAPGELRELSHGEVRKLRQATGGSSGKKRASKGAKRSPRSGVKR